MSATPRAWRVACGPASLCRMDAEFIRALDTPLGLRRAMAGAALAVVVGGGAYGFAFGVWRSPLQGLYSAVKLPCLFFATALASGLVNAMLAQVLGSGLSFRQVAMAVLFGLAVAAALMGGLSPAVLLFVLQAPGPDPAALGLPDASPVVARALGPYWALLLAHVGVIALCGAAGFIRLFRLLRALGRSRAMAGRLMLAWIAVTGFVGCELAWLLSPFLCKPNQPPHVVARAYFESNFYERVWRAACNLQTKEDHP